MFSSPTSCSTSLNSFSMAEFIVAYDFDFSRCGEVIYLLGDEISTSSLQSFISFGARKWKLPTLELISWVLVQTTNGPFGIE